MWHAGKKAFHLNSCYLNEKCVYILTHTCVHMWVCVQGSLNLEVLFYDIILSSSLALWHLTREEAQLLTTHPGWPTKGEPNQSTDRPTDNQQARGVNLRTSSHLLYCLGLHSAVSERKPQITAWTTVQVFGQGTFDAHRVRSQARSIVLFILDSPHHRLTTVSAVFQ